MSRGFTLLEVLVALVVLEVGLMGVVGMLVLAHRLLGEAEVRERMNGEVVLVLDSLARTASWGDGERETPWGTLRWSVDGRRLLVEARPSRGGGFRLAAPRAGAGREGDPPER